MSVEQEPPRLRLPADVRGSEEVEDFRPSLPAFAAPRFGEWSEEQMLRLVGVQLEPEALETLARVGTKPRRVTLVLQPGTTRPHLRGRAVRSSGAFRRTATSSRCSRTVPSLPSSRRVGTLRSPGHASAMLGSRLLARHHRLHRIELTCSRWHEISKQRGTPDYRDEREATARAHADPRDPLPDPRAVCFPLVRSWRTRHGRSWPTVSVGPRFKKHYAHAIGGAAARVAFPRASERCAFRALKE